MWITVSLHRNLHVIRIHCIMNSLMYRGMVNTICSILIYLCRLLRTWKLCTSPKLQPCRMVVTTCVLVTTTTTSCKCAAPLAHQAVPPHQTLPNTPVLSSLVGPQLLYYYLHSVGMVCCLLHLAASPCTYPLTLVNPHIALLK